MNIRKALLLTTLSLAAWSNPLPGKATVDWMQDNIRAKDVSVSHDGQSYIIGTDKKVYKWNSQDWQPEGGRSDFEHIDASEDGIAALTESGSLYIKGDIGWVSTGVRAGDVGLSAGQIWLASAQNSAGGLVTLQGEFDPTGEAMNWTPVKGVLDRIDVDPEGRPWGVDNQGLVFVYADGTWIQDREAPKALDIGVGGDGSVYIVGADYDEALGGGRVYSRNALTGEWSIQPGRLSAISVTPDGKAFGANSLNWLMASLNEGAPAEEGGQLPDNQTFTKQGDMTLADIVGTAVPGADKVKLASVSVTEDTIKGTVELDGSPVEAVLHQLDPKEFAVIAGLQHQSIDLGTYIPKIRNTDLGSFGLLNAVFYMQPESAEKIEYATFDDMPAPLSDLVKVQKDYKDLFPLTIHPGVTVIGTYAPADNNAKAVMKAYGMGEDGYTVKGHFKLSQLQNLSFDIPNAPKRPSSKSEACQQTSSAALTGLDLSFPIPNFKPPYAEGAVSFTNAKFSLKEIDGDIEPSIVTALNLNLPEKKIGIKNIPMAGKLSVQGNLNVLCNGINSETEGKVSIAAATTFNAEAVEGAAMGALERVSEDGAESPDIEELGWKNAFGLPFLNIRQYAFSGTFTQVEEDGALKRTLDTTVWSNSVADRAELDLFGTMSYEIKPDELEITNWSFETEGPIAFNDLPGLKDMPKVDEFGVKDISLTPGEMMGTLTRQNKALEATAYFAREETAEAADDFDVFLQFNALKPTSIYDFLPEAVTDVQLAPALIAWSNKETRELAYKDAPENLQPLLKGLIEEDDDMTIGQGLTLAGRTQTTDIFGGKVTRFINDYLDISGGIGLFGVFAEDSEAGRMNGELRGMLDSFKVKNFPESLVTYKDSEIILSNVEGAAIEIETKANVQAPGKNTLLDMSGTLTYEETSETENRLEVALSSDYLWNNPFKIPELQVTNLGLGASFEKKGTNTSQELSFTGDGIFRKQAGKVSIDLESMQWEPEFASVTFEGELKVSELLSLPAGAEDIADATFRKIVLGTNAIGGDLQFTAKGFDFDGRGAVIFDNDGAALFLRYDKDLAIGKMVDDIPPPFRDVTLPKGLVIISPRAIDSFDANFIPDAIYDDVLAGLIDQDEAYKLKVDDGLTFMTRVKPSIFPAPIPAMLETPFGIKATNDKGEPNEIYIAGSVGGMFDGGDPSLGFYTMLQGVTPSFPDFVKEFIEFKDANLKLFVQSKKGSAGSVEVGVAADAKIKPRRLDDPTVVQPLDGTFALTYSAGSDGTSLTGSTSVNGQWADPLGLEGYRLQNPSISFGMEEKGITIGIHTDRADFKQGNTNKAFVFDLDTTWAGGVPTDLAVQFAKTKDTNELLLTPVDLARVQKSIFDLAFRSGSKLKDAIILGLDQLPTPPDPLLSTLKQNAPSMINQLSSLIDNANNGMFSLIEQSPLSMIGVKNPVIYFGTPGSTPPSNPDIDRPPLGLGLQVAGAFTVDMGLLDTDLANGVYKVNLSDGYLVQGTVTPPSPFSSNIITVSGNTPIFGGPQHLSFNGKLEVPGAEVAGISLGVEGTFDVSRGSMLDPTASVYADVSIGGLLSRTGTMTLNGTTLSFNSPGSCTDIPPLDISGSLQLSGFTAESMTTALLTSFRPMVPDPIECASDIGEAFKDIAEGVVDVISDPVGNAEELVDDVGGLITNPGEALENAGKMAQMPLNAAEALGDAGISLVKMGLDKVPVLGPGAGQAIGAAYDQARQLKDAAVNAVTNNAVTNFMGSAISAGYDAVTGIFKTSERTWYTVNPLRCIAGERYWNQIFRQCFEHGAVVLFDNTTRQSDGLGECIVTAHTTSINALLGSIGPPTFAKGALGVGTCKGNGFNQFHLDSATDQIRAVKKAYNGKVGNFLGPDEDVCLTRRLKDMGSGLNKDDVYVHRCAYGAVNQEWTYTDDMKLKNGDKCITRNENNALTMGNCESATPWLGTSVVPDWNLAKDVPIRGQITHVQSGRCLNWWDRGPHRLIKCGDAPGLDRDLRTHVRLRVLDDDNTLSIMGSAFWNQHEHPCVGLTGENSDAVMTRWCWPASVYEEAQWKAWPIINNRIDKSGNIPLIDVLTKHQYVFENVQNGKCLTTSMTEDAVKDENNRPWVNAVEGCTGWGGNAKTNVRFVGYAADAVAQNVIDSAAAEAKRAFELARYEMLPILQEWQQYRVRAENARIREARKMSSSLNTNIRKVQRDRKSPGHCKHNEYWNNTLKTCSEGVGMLLNYHGSDGAYKGCLQETTGYYDLRIKANCDLTNEHQAIVNTMAFFFDSQNRIVKKNVEFKVDVRDFVDENGNPILSERGNRQYIDAGDVESDQGDTCLGQNRSVVKIDGNIRPAGFGSCASESAKWRYSPQGELISPEGMCLRNYHYKDKVYSRDNVNKVEDLVNADPQLKAMRENITTAESQVIRDKEDFRIRNGLRITDPRVKEEYDRLIQRVKDLKDEATQYKNTLRQQLRQQYPTYLEGGDKSNLGLVDCTDDPMQAGKRRWVPMLGNDFSAIQELPKTARIKPAANDNLCMTGNMTLDGDMVIAPCADDNPNQYIAFGGTDKTRFLISPRNSRTCLYDSGNGTIAHRACKASGAEMFLQIDEGNGEVKLQNALSGNCLTVADNNVIEQAPCAQATVFKLETIDSIETVNFAGVATLQINTEKLGTAQSIWNKAEKRAEYIYMGAYLKAGNALLQKGDDDSAVMTTSPGSVTLERLPSHVGANGIVYIPAVTAPKTEILTLPGFDNGATTVTFAHARPVEFSDGKPTRDHTSDPYAPHFADWFVWAHHQKVLKVSQDGALRFDYMDESEAFRKAASFKMIPESDGGDNRYAFESISNPGQYLNVSNGILTLSPQKTSLIFESTAQWFKSDSINLLNFSPPYRAPKPPFDAWVYPESGYVLKQ